MVESKNGSKKEQQLQEMLLKTTHDNEQLKQQLQQMIQINNSQQIKLANAVQPQQMPVSEIIE